MHKETENRRATNVFVLRLVDSHDSSIAGLWHAWGRWWS